LSDEEFIQIVEKIAELKKAIETYEQITKDLFEMSEKLSCNVNQEIIDLVLNGINLTLFCAKKCQVNSVQDISFLCGSRQEFVCMPTMVFLPAPMALVRGWGGEWRNYLWRYNK